MELYESSADLNFNFAESLNAKEKDRKCVIAFSDSYETGHESDAMSHKQRNQANARERYRTHRYRFLSTFVAGDFTAKANRDLFNLSKFIV